MDVYGSARLQKYNMERKLKYVSDGENIIIELDGLTCRGDFSRLIHKLFNENARRNRRLQFGCADTGREILHDFMVKFGAVSL